MGGRPKINLEPYKDQIIQWMQGGHTAIEIRERLYNEHSLIVSKSTYSRILYKWHLRTPMSREAYTDSPLLRRRIVFIFRYLHLTDKAAFELLESEGFNIGPQRMRRLRRDMGLMKQVPSRRDASGRIGVPFQKAVADDAQLAKLVGLPRGVDLPRADSVFWSTDPDAEDAEDVMQTEPRTNLIPRP